MTLLEGFWAEGVWMAKLSSHLGFEARYVIYPVLVLVVGAVAKLVIRRYAHKWAEKTENQLDNRIVQYLDRIMTPLILMAVLYGLSHWLPLNHDMRQNLQKGVLILIVFLVAYFGSRLASSILTYVGERRDAWQRFLQPFNTLSKVFFLLVAVAIAFRILDVNMSTDGLKFVRIVGIVAGAVVVLRIIKLAVQQIEQFVRDKDAAASEAHKRARTLGKIINNASVVVIIGVSLMMILSEFGMNITPIITGAGIVGLAVGFGAQNLVRDVISGFFIILEDQIRVGDVAKINGTGGTVEAINLRTTILRDAEGIVYIFPNGEIKQVANLTKEYSYYVIDVGVAYKENVDRVMEVLKECGEELSRDPNYAPLILAPIEVMGVDDFADSQVTIKTRIKTRPLQQWGVGRELRRRIKLAFDRHGIEMPFPHLSVYFGEASKPFEVAVKNRDKA